MAARPRPSHCKLSSCTPSPIPVDSLLYRRGPLVRQRATADDFANSKATWRQRRVILPLDRGSDVVSVTDCKRSLAQPCAFLSGIVQNERQRTNALESFWRGKHADSAARIAYEDSRLVCASSSVRLPRHDRGKERAHPIFDLAELSRHLAGAAVHRR